MDYLVSVVNQLDEDTSAVDPRDIKCAVLHLQAAAEVLLKFRLLREHWSLAFPEPGVASKKKYLEANFKSCTMDDAVQRLWHIAGVSITEKEQKALRDLAQDRNALQHYGLTHNAKAVEARAGAVLDFLLRFLDEELLPQLSREEQQEISSDMEQVHDGLTRIQSFVTKRMNRLRGTELKGADNRILQCVICEQVALIVFPGGGRCHFCAVAWTALELARETGWGLSVQCPECDEGTLLLDGVHFAGSSSPTPHCFNCDTSYASDELGSCAVCGRPWSREGGDDGTISTLCSVCVRHVHHPDEHETPEGE